MRIFSVKIISDFIKIHADTRKPLANWLRMAEKAIWNSPQEVKEHFPSASILPDNQMVFNIKGNHYRLTVQIAYKMGIISILHIETHAEYSKRIRSTE